ncbi:hypothetical protein DesyoDRAFT_1553 [Desulfosporosinus youngiae DSM 17734]|uniref:Uncharacterized protein n=1 Tax=Desulfosporosinus youngiae DSM 17734 TaxID=768710 RepID=H5Y2K1_9FIRM|nr:hypothetical protein DesyoDRAFT_1553 [Desulfosporosinus youngiae DSM 17734]
MREELFGNDATNWLKQLDEIVTRAIKGVTIDLNSVVLIPQNHQISKRLGI